MKKCADYLSKQKGYYKATNQRIEKLTRDITSQMKIQVKNNLKNFIQKRFSKMRYGRQQKVQKDNS